MVLIICTKNDSNLTNRYWDMVPDRQKVWTDGLMHGRRQNYIPPTLSGDKKSTTTEPPPYNGQQPKPPGLKHLKQHFGHLNPLSVLLIRQQIWQPSSKNLSDFKCFFKIRWTIDRDVPTIRAILRTVNLASPSMICFIFWNDLFKRWKFWPTWSWCIFNGLYTRFKFILPASNCAIRHTRRSLSSRKFSHQLLQRTTKFSASFHLSGRRFYQPFLPQWSMAGCINMANFMSYFSITCTFIHRCVDLEWTYKGI